MDPHLHRHPTLSAVYTIPTTTLHAAPLLADWIAQHVEKPLIVGPDEESEQWAGAIAARIGVPHAVLRKTRHGDRSVDIDAPDLSSWRDRTPVLVDDIASSGRTLIMAAHKLVEQGMRRPECVVVHALFAEDAWTHLVPCSPGITSTDAVPHASNGIALAPCSSKPCLAARPIRAADPRAPHIPRRADMPPHQTNPLADWRAGYGPIVHRAETIERMQALVQRLVAQHARRGRGHGPYTAGGGRPPQLHPP